MLCLSLDLVKVYITHQYFVDQYTTISILYWIDLKRFCCNNIESTCRHTESSVGTKARLLKVHHAHAQEFLGLERDQRNDVTNRGTVDDHGNVYVLRPNLECNDRNVLCREQNRFKLKQPNSVFCPLIIYVTIRSFVCRKTYKF